MTKSKKESLLLGPLLKRLAPTIGAKVVLEPVWGIAGQVTYKSGRRRYFRFNTLDLNPVGASDIAKDKDYAAFFLKKMGYRTIQGDAFYSGRWAETISSKKDIDAAYRYARKLGFPVIVKPNSGSQGSGVALVYDKREFYRAMREIFKNDKIALVQRRVKGKDYRIVVLDGKVISAYERTPLTVVGDGSSSILTLLRKKQRDFERKKRDTLIRFRDPRMREKLRRMGLTWKSVPPKGMRIALLDNANLSSGGGSHDVTERVHPAFRKLATSITKDMGLRLCGVDLMIEGDIAEKPKRYYILEVNAAPGLDHYARHGKEQQKIVEDLYLKVLKSLAH